jgi:HTH-type transcriptional regulator/antitoxin HipB
MDAIRTPAQLGPVLRAARLQQGLTQADLARRLGISTQAFSRMESHAERASFDRVHRLCLLLGLDILIHPKHTTGSKAVREPDAGW